MIPIPLCDDAAALYYHVPAIILKAIGQEEAGWAGARVQDKNGTADHGLMQINSVWRAKLHQQGWRMHTVQWHDCASVFVGAWILRQDIQRAHNFWKGVAWYQSKDMVYGYPFAKKVYEIAKKDLSDGATVTTK